MLDNVKAQQQTLAVEGSETPMFSAIRLDVNKLLKEFRNAPEDNSHIAKSFPFLYDFTMPNGSKRVFKVVRNALMAPEFSKQFPDFLTLSLRAYDDESITGRATLTPYGFLMTIFTPDGIVEMAPEDMSDPFLHKISYTSSDNFVCGFDGLGQKVEQLSHTKSAFSNGGTIRTYQFAIVTTGEFGTTHGGVGPATTVVTQQVGALEDIYEKELAVKFQLLTPLVYTNPSTDPFPSGNSDRTLMAAEAIANNWTNPADYDIGHVLHSTGGGSWGGGIAYFGLCNDGLIPGSTNGRYKGGAWSSVGTSPSGSVGLFAHEVGHQFYMAHSFNGIGGSCTSNISEDDAYEIASGTTIMSYNGICQANNNIPSAGAADNYFHTHSLGQAIARMSSTSCASTSSSGNTPPRGQCEPLRW